MFVRRLSFVLGLLLFSVPCARAQFFAVYAMGSGGFLGSSTASQGSLLVGNNGFSAFGGTFGAYADLAHLGPVHFAADGRYFQQSGNNSKSYGNKMNGALGGLRLALAVPAVPVKPYLQAEVGGIGTNYGAQPNSVGSFAYQIQGGLDFTVFPHLDIRAEYGGGQIDGQSSGSRLTVQQAGVGLVVRF